MRMSAGLPEEEASSTRCRSQIFRGDGRWIGGAESMVDVGRDSTMHGGWK